MRALNGLLMILKDAGTKSEVTLGLIPSMVLTAVQMEGPRFSTRTSVGERPSEKTPLGLGWVTGEDLESLMGLIDALDDVGVACEAWRIGECRKFAPSGCRQRCMKSSALLRLAMALLFILGQRFTELVRGPQAQSSHAVGLQADLVGELTLPSLESAASA